MAKLLPLGLEPSDHRNQSVLQEALVAAKTIAVACDSDDSRIEIAERVALPTEAHRIIPADIAKTAIHALVEIATHCTTAAGRDTVATNLKINPPWARHFDEGMAQAKLNGLIHLADAMSDNASPTGDVLSLVQEVANWRYSSDDASTLQQKARRALERWGIPPSWPVENRGSMAGTILNTTVARAARSVDVPVPDEVHARLDDGPRLADEFGEVGSG